MSDAGGRRVLVTGASGLIGRKLIRALADRVAHLVALDLRPDPGLPDGVAFAPLDIRSPDLGALLAEHAIDTVVHLAAVVGQGRLTRQEMYDIDVGGTDNVLAACTAHGVRQLVVTSSGAAYGYHAGAPPRLSEDDPLRGNDAFTYARHKRLVEERLADYRRQHPSLRQLVFRPGTVLGAGSHSEVSRLFERGVVVGVARARCPFTFMLDDEVAHCLALGVLEQRTGIYNLTADGTVELREIARRAGKRYLALPAPVLRAVLAALRGLRLVPYGPEQVVFLQHRPVLANDRLKSEFGYTPRLDSRQVLDLWCDSHGLRPA